MSCAGDGPLSVRRPLVYFVPQFLFLVIHVTGVGVENLITFGLRSPVFVTVEIVHGDVTSDWSPLSTVVTSGPLMDPVTLKTLKVEGV